MRLFRPSQGRKRRNSDENLESGVSESAHLLSDDDESESGLLDTMNHKVSMLTEEQIRNLVDSQVRASAMLKRCVSWT